MRIIAYIIILLLVAMAGWTRGWYDGRACMVKSIEASCIDSWAKNVIKNWGDCDDVLEN